MAVDRRGEILKVPIPDMFQELWEAIEAAKTATIAANKAAREAERAGEAAGAAAKKAAEDAFSQISERVKALETKVETLDDVLVAIGTSLMTKSDGKRLVEEGFIKKLQDAGFKFKTGE